MKNIIRYTIGGILVLGGVISIIDNSTNSIITTIIAILFGISLMPIIYEKYLCKINIPKLSIILPILLFIVMAITVPKDDAENAHIENNKPDSKKIEVNNKARNIKKNKTKKINYKNLKNITNSKIKNNFKKACQQINMDISKIKKLKKVDDWNSGPRYTFEYSGEKFVLYAYDSGEISSITISNNNLDKIYLEGYEPYDVNDYLLTNEEIIDLQISTEKSIKSILNHPDTAKFKWSSSGSYEKHNNVYAISGIVEAKNSFGVKNEAKFYVEEEITDGNYNVVYMIVDGKKYIGTESKIEKKERNQLETDTNDNTSNQSKNSIVLKDGQTGKYGKEDMFDGEKYIRYYIPEGKYEVEALTKNAQFFIEEINIHKEEGWDTSTVIRKVTISKYGDKDTIEIKSDQCISLVSHTQIKLIKQ